MVRNQSNSIFFFTNALKVLKFFADAPEREFIGSDVQDGTGLSKAGVYFALRDLENQCLVSKHRKGRSQLNIYELKNSSPVVRQYRVLKTVLSLEKLVEMLKPVSRKIILFGSAGRGEDTSESDIDIFVLSKDSSAARKIVNSYTMGLYSYLMKDRKIQAVIKTQVEYSGMKEKDKVFQNEVDRGIVLWGDENDPEIRGLSEEGQH